MPRDYNFWVYIVTNIHDSVLYIGMTNDLARRVSEHRSGEIDKSSRAMTNLRAVTDLRSP